MMEFFDASMRSKSVTSCKIERTRKWLRNIVCHASADGPVRATKVKQGNSVRNYRSPIQPPGRCPSVKWLTNGAAYKDCLREAKSSRKF